MFSFQCYSGVNISFRYIYIKKAFAIYGNTNQVNIMEAGCSKSNAEGTSGKASRLLQQELSMPDFSHPP